MDNAEMEVDNEERKKALAQMLQCVSSLIEDKRIAAAVSTNNQDSAVLQEVLKLAEELKSGVLNTGQPCISLECIIDKFVRNKQLEPIFNQLSSTRRVDEDKMSQYLWHLFYKRVTSKHFDFQDRPRETTNCEVKIEAGAALEPYPQDAWVKLEDFPFLSNQEDPAEAENESEEMEQDSSEILNSQALVEDENKITIAEFLEQCQKANDEEFDSDFVVRLCAQSEPTLSILFSSCSKSDIFIPLLLTSANQHVELAGPFCDQVLLPLSQREGLDGQILAKTCSLIISYPLLMAGRLLVPLIKDPNSRSLVIKIIKFCEKEEVKHAVLTSLLNLSEWKAKKQDLELLQCLLSVSVPKNPLTAQLVCQLFVGAEIELYSSNDFAKLLLQIIKYLKGSMTDECKNLLRTAVASIKSPLKALMEKQLL